MSEIEGQFLTFSLKSQIYGAPIDCVKEINRMIEITEVPHTENFIKGVINLRGKVIPVVDLRLKFAMEESEYTKNTCIIVIEGESGEVGIVVDSVAAVVDLEHSQIEPPPSLGDDQKLSFVIGLGKVEDEIIILVDILNCLSKENLNKVVEVAKENSSSSEQAA